MVDFFGYLVDRHCQRLYNHSTLTLFLDPVYLFLKKKSFYKNGNLKYSLELKNGIENGAFKQYYENGVLEIEAFYKNGKLEGIRKDYYKSGKLEVEGLQKNGKPDGCTYVYNEDGSLKKEILYIDGKGYKRKKDKE